MNRKAAIFMGLLAVSAATWAEPEAFVEHAPLQPQSHYPVVAVRFARFLEREHLSGDEFNNAVSSRAWTNLLSSLDYDRVYFVQSDIDKLKRYEFLLDDLLMNGDTRFAFEAFELFKERVRNRYDYVVALLEKDFDLEKDENVDRDRKDAAWPATEEEWNDLWRRKVKNEYVQRLIMDELKAAEAEKRKKEGKTDKPEDDDDALTAPEEELSPKEAIKKRYRQFVTVLNDNDAEWVLQRYLSSVGHAFDPHSGYMSPATVEDFDIHMQLSLVGIGAILTAEDGAARVQQLIVGGPAEKDGRLKPGDKIIAVGEGSKPVKDILHWPLSKAVRLIRGKKGTKVVLVVIPVDNPSGPTRRITLVRDEVQLEEQAVKWEPAEIEVRPGKTRKVAVITVPAFYASMKSWLKDEASYRSSTADVAATLQEIRDDPSIEGVILDLRNNGGGYLPEAVQMTGLFIKQGPVVQVKDRHRLQAKVLSDQDEFLAYDGPMLLLVNRLSASASEIVAGALQDYGRAIVAGDSKTHGKGTVQAVVKLGRDTKLGSAKITTAMYYRVSGETTQVNGVRPDIVIPSVSDNPEFGEEHLPNPLRGDPTDKVSFQPMANVSSLVPELKARSTRRIDGDERFKTYRDLLAKLTEITEMEELSLKLSKRRELAQAEKEMRELWKKLSEMVPKDKKKDDKSDLVLNEAARILLDMVDLKKKGGTEIADEPENKEEKKPVADTFIRWIRDAL